MHHLNAPARSPSWGPSPLTARRGTVAWRVYAAALAVLFACGLAGCASSPLDSGGELVSISETLSSVTSPRGGYWIEIPHPAFSTTGEALGYGEADLALVFPQHFVVLVSYAFEDPDITIDQVASFRRSQLRDEALDPFQGEERFFLADSDHRPAALLSFSRPSGFTVAGMRTLIVDTDSGPIEVVAWATDVRGLAEIDDIVLGLQLGED